MNGFALRAASKSLIQFRIVFMLLKELRVSFFVQCYQCCFKSFVSKSFWSQQVIETARAANQERDFMRGDYRQI